MSADSGGEDGVTYRDAPLRSGGVLRVPEGNPGWFDTVIHESDTAHEAAGKIRARLREPRDG